MADRAFGVLADGHHILAVVADSTGTDAPLTLPGGTRNSQEDFDACIARHAFDQTGLRTEIHRWLYEDLAHPDGGSENCFLLMLEDGEMPSIGSIPTTEGTRWIDAAGSRDPRILRILPLLDYEPGWGPGKIPFNWADIRDKSRELCHRLNRTARYLAKPPASDREDNLLGQALISVQEHIPRDPLTIWNFVRRWGTHPARAIRGRIGVYLLEDLLRDHFDLLFPKVRHLARQDPLFADCVLSCWIVGKASRPANRRRMLTLMKEIGANRTWRTLCAASIPEALYSTITLAPEPRSLDPLPQELMEAIEKSRTKG